MTLKSLKLTLESCVLITFEMRGKNKIKEFKSYMHRLNMNKMPLKAQGHLSKVTLTEQHFCYPLVELFSYIEIRNKMDTWKRATD